MNLAVQNLFNNCQSMNQVSSSNGYVVMNGAFTSPLATMMPGLLPPEAETAR